MTAWTGDVVIDVQPGMIRLQWYTVRPPPPPQQPAASFIMQITNATQTDGNFGKRDYELREHAEAQTGWETLCNLPEVDRAMIVGYPSQNPYSIDGKSQWVVQEMKKKEIMQSQEYRDLVPRKKKEPGIGDRIDDIIQDEDLREKKRRQREEKQGFAGTEEV